MGESIKKEVMILINKYWNLEEYNFGELADAVAPTKPYSAVTIEDPFQPGKK